MALGVALFLLAVGAGRSLFVHRLSLPFSSACPLNPPPSLPLFPLTGQETKEISWEQVGVQGGLDA